MRQTSGGPIRIEALLLDWIALALFSAIFIIASIKLLRRTIR